MNKIMKTKQQRVLTKKDLFRALDNELMIEELHCNHTNVAYEMGLNKQICHWKVVINDRTNRPVLKEVTEYHKVDKKDRHNWVMECVGAYEKVNWILFQWEENGNNRDGLVDFAKSFMEEENEK